MRPSGYYDAARGINGMSTSRTGSSPNRPHPHPGFFLALEGPDGGGKSTQSARLAAWLRDEGLDVVTCRDPGSTALGEKLREVILHNTEIQPSMRTEMLLYMASRAQLVDDVVRPSLAAGRVVVSDRFLLSNIVYQGIAGGLPLEDIAKVGAVATGDLLPDLTIILDISHNAARARMGAVRDRIEQRSEEYHDRVRRGFLETGSYAAKPEGCWYFPAPIALIEGEDEPESVFARIQKEVGNVLALGPRS